MKGCEDVKEFEECWSGDGRGEENIGGWKREGTETGGAGDFEGVEETG